MSIIDELSNYYCAHTAQTMHVPHAVPLTIEEYERLREEANARFVMIKGDPEAMPQFLGMDIYIVPDAKKRRGQFVE